MMTSHKEHLIEQKILEYKSKLKHIDELIEHADKCIESSSIADDIENELNMIKTMRDQLADSHNFTDKLSSKNWQTETTENTGPMVVWDTVAQRIESLIEKFDSKK